jgi:hypothetical protein
MVNKSEEAESILLNRKITIEDKLLDGLRYLAAASKERSLSK